MARDENVFVVGEDVGGAGGAFSATRDLLARFGPRRVRDTPISEAAIVGIATGAALRGLRPVAEIMFADFLTLAMDQIVNQLAKARYMFGGMYTMPVVIRAPCGAGLHAGPQHSQSLEAWFAHVPGLKVVMPATPHDVKGLLKSAIRDDNPVLFLENKALYAMKGEIPDGEYLVPIGKAEVKRPGKDVTVVTDRKEFAASVEVVHMYVMRKRFRQGDAEALDLKPFKHPVKVIEGSTIDEIREGEVVLVDRDFRKTVLPCDHVVTCWTRPNTALLDLVRAAGLPVANVGDSVRPRNLHAAVREGAGLGLALDGNGIFNPNGAAVDGLPIDVLGQLTRK